MTIIKEDNCIIALNNNNNGIKLDTENKNVFILIWNKIEGKFNEFPTQSNYYKELKKLDIPTHKKCVEVNKTIYSACSQKGQLRIINLLKTYDGDNYKPYDPKDKNNITYRGLTPPQKESVDDYLYMMDDIDLIEENPSDWNTSYDQMIVYRPNQFLGNIRPGACWRIQ